MEPCRAPFLNPFLVLSAAETMRNAPTCLVGRLQAVTPASSRERHGLIFE